VLPSFGNEKSRSMCLVQNWQYWGKYGWNAMKSDEDYTHPKEMSPYGPPSASFVKIALGLQNRRRTTLARGLSQARRPYSR
jgi:hypothetical protein